MTIEKPYLRLKTSEFAYVSDIFDIIYISVEELKKQQNFGYRFFELKEVKKT